MEIHFIIRYCASNLKNDYPKHKVNRLTPALDATRQGHSYQ